MSALRRLLLLMVAAGVAGVWLRRHLEPAPPSLPPATGDEVTVASEMGPVTDEMNAIPLPLEEELARVEEAEPEASAEEQDTVEVDIVDVVDDLLEPETPEAKQ